jgi:hypothetical protein
MTMILELTVILSIVWLTAMAIYLRPVRAAIRARQGK